MLATRCPRPGSAMRRASVALTSAGAVAGSLSRAIALHGPSLCAVCRGWGRGRVCANCLDRFAAPVPRCRRCALPLVAPRRSLRHLPDERAAFRRRPRRVDYRPPWDRLVTAFKFHGALDLAAVFAEAIVGAERRRAAPRPSLVLPVPLGAAAAARARLQPGLGAGAPGRASARSRRASPTSCCACARRAHQLALPLAERAGNVRGAFAVEPRRRAELRGRRIAVVDDVMTTGSTAAEIAARPQAGRRGDGRDLGAGAHAARRATPRNATTCSTSSSSRPRSRRTPAT